jgi:heat-inducible transcriptional repressor
MPMPRPVRQAAGRPPRHERFAIFVPAPVAARRPVRYNLQMPAVRTLDDRARRILGAIVRDHIEGGEPVGSHVIARRAEVDCSSATVRAVMADLEALGYLEKPHTSAGRVPTSRGYRYYVDALLHVKKPPQQEREQIEQKVQDAAGQMDGLMAATSRMLHSLTRHAGVVASPRPQSERLQRIELLPLREGRILAVLVARSGAVHNRLLTIPSGQLMPSPSELEQGANYLNTLIVDLTLDEAQSRLKAELERDRAQLDELRTRSLLLGTQAMRPGEGPSVHLEGQSSFLEDPALVQDVAKMRALFKALDEKTRLLEVLNRALEAEELTIFIGAESGISGAELSIVAAPYRIAGEIVGALGVIGPTRMDYARVVPLVAFTARTVGLALDPRD